MGFVARMLVPTLSDVKGTDHIIAPRRFTHLNIEYRGALDGRGRRQRHQSPFDASAERHFNDPVRHVAPNPSLSAEHDTVRPSNVADHLAVDHRDGNLDVSVNSSGLTDPQCGRRRAFETPHIAVVSTIDVKPA
jgi:hypothetical protein